MSSNTRITVASLAAALAEHQANTNAALLALTDTVGKLAQAVGQHNTPAAVVDITSAPSTRKASKKASKKAAPAPAKPVAREMPAELREGFAVVKATKDAMSPLNKALMVVCKGTPWVKATERSIDQINAALAHVAEKDGLEVAQAALEAYKVRAQAAANRK